MNEKLNKLKNECDKAVANYSLLNHPFYQAWNEGTLPVEALQSYAAEYGAFIKRIPAGWQTLGKPSIVKHEIAHAKIWNDSFAAALNTAVSEPEIPEVEGLVDTAAELFSQKATALGALYCFEVQQPLTAQSKMRGLEEHYSDLPNSCSDYFRLHTGDYDEVSLLAEMMEDTSEPESAAVLDACNKMGKALYDALTGIYEPFACVPTAH